MADLRIRKKERKLNEDGVFLIQTLFRKLLKHPKIYKPTKGRVEQIQQTFGLCEFIMNDELAYLLRVHCALYGQVIEHPSWKVITEGEPEYVIFEL